MSSSWSWQDEQRLHTVVQVPDQPASQPTEWDTDDGLGFFIGLRNALPIVAVFYALVAVVGYLVFKR